MAEVMTYDSLVSDIESYLERTDADTVAQIPRFIMLAENTLATELKILGFQIPVIGSFAINQPTISKPAYWKDTISFNYTDASGNRVEILPRSYEYCRNYWPNSNSSGSPRFYADYNFDNFLIVPTPSAAFNFELVYHARLQPLDSSHQTNWLTMNAPQLLLAASMVEAFTWTKNDDGLGKWQPKYDRALAAFNAEGENRIDDRTTVNG
jgi:hypothetical protein